MTSPTSEQIQELVHRYFDDLTDAGETAELAALLRSSPEARRIFVQAARMDSALHECFRQQEAELALAESLRPAPAAPASRRRAKNAPPPAYGVIRFLDRSWWASRGEHVWGPAAAVALHVAIIVILLNVTLFHRPAGPESDSGVRVVVRSPTTPRGAEGLEPKTAVHERPAIAIIDLPTLPDDLGGAGTVEMPELAVQVPNLLPPSRDRIWSQLGRLTATLPAFSGRLTEQRLALLSKSVGAQAVPVDKALARAENWLMERQTPSGAWGEADINRTVETTSLAIMALLARLEGGAMNHGKSQPIRNGLNYLVAHQQPDGSFGGVQGYPLPTTQALATYALAESRAVIRTPAVEQALALAIERAIELQGSDGLWSMEGGEVAAPGSPWATAWFVEALHAARLTGFATKEVNEALEKARAGLARYAQPASAPTYYGDLKTGSVPPTTHLIAAMHSLQLEGQSRAPAALRGLRALESIPVRWDDATAGWPAMSWYHLAQVHHRAGEAFWLKWHGEMTGMLLARQLPDGRWEHPYSRKSGYSSQFDTALSCLTLATSFRYAQVDPAVAWAFALAMQ